LTCIKRTGGGLLQACIRQAAKEKDMARSQALPMAQSGTARDDSAERLFELGIMYSSGRSVPTDLVAAHKWFNLAAMQGSAEAAQHRHEIAVQMSAAEIAAAQRAAREWRRSLH
jgi:TPR repeat protein